MNTTTRQLAAIGIAAAALCALPARAADIFYFDFEDGQLGPWQPSTTGGSGSTRVIQIGNDHVALVSHDGTFQHVLSYDFSYVPDAVLSFEMQAVAVTTTARNSGAGVRISFTDQFNVVLDRVGYWNVTNPTALSGHDRPIDISTHVYSAPLRDFATAAGLGPTANIYKVSMSFIAYGESTALTSASASVWFDDVRLAAVPEPSQQALLLTGLAALGMAARTRRRREER